MAHAQREGMYLVVPVAFRVVDGEFFVEAQAANGLDRWADHFSRVVVAAPVIPEAMVATLSGFVWRSLASLEHSDRIVPQPLPWAYSPRTFFKEKKRVRALMARSIAEAAHLQFAIGGLIGDWAALAALEAIKQKRSYAIHTDRVEHELIRKLSSGVSTLNRIRIAIEAPLMEWYHRHVIRGCSLGLWHGDDCYRAYAPWCKQSHLVHDIHTKLTDLIGKEDLTQKLAALRSGEPLKIVYAGRLDTMKAPLEWLAAIAEARDRGIILKASWYGEGPLRAEALQLREQLGLQEIVEFPGFVSGRPEMLMLLREAHMLVFTHITPESPRNLIESLVSGTPIIGYENPYAVNLLAAQGGGSLVKVHDTHNLGVLIAELAQDHERLAAMTLQAAANGRQFTDAAVFLERSELIKQFA